MGFGRFESGESQPMADINIVPLVDVMLVLLIIFIVTTPLLTQTLKVELPQTQSQAPATPPVAVHISLDAEAKLFVDDEALEWVQLGQRLAQVATQQPQPELHLSVDKAARYQALAELLDAARQAGLSKIGFVTQPQTGKP
jgi:biopolymer transport protein ExbD